MPAQVRGDWQARDWRIAVSQNFQVIEVEVTLGGRPLKVAQARVEGTAFAFSGEGFVFRGRASPDRIEGELERGGARGPLVFVRGR